ncbi:MAG: hypothetical protein NTY07_18180 [Bacteroidia bacterium]|nr:hypothetical protein [Bacteroidia bacterium]
MKNKIILFVSFAAVIFSLNSCLKDKVGDYWPDDVAGKMYATVPSYTLQQLALRPVVGDVPFSFLVTIVITKGTRNATANAKVWGAETLDACATFMTAISITSAKTASGKDVTIAGNMKSYLLSLPISNPYAADYHTVGYRIRPGNATEPVDATQTFATLNCKTVRKTGFGNYSAYDITIEVTSTTVVVGGTTCYKVIATPIDPGTGISVGGMWPVWTGDAAQKPADLTINYYNPVTKTFVLNCWYTSSAGNRIMYEVNTRK